MYYRQTVMRQRCRAYRWCDTTDSEQIYGDYVCPWLRSCCPVGGPGTRQISIGSLHYQMANWQAFLYLPKVNQITLLLCQYNLPAYNRAIDSGQVDSLLPVGNFSWVLATQSVIFLFAVDFDGRFCLSAFSGGQTPSPFGYKWPHQRAIARLHQMSKKQQRDMHVSCRHSRSISLCPIGWSLLGCFHFAKYN